MEPVERPILAITMGDPAGIGPEVVLKALSHHEVYDGCRPLVVGDGRILARADPWIGTAHLEFQRVDAPGQGSYRPGTVTLLDLHNAAPDACPPGRVGTTAGRAAVEYVVHACDLALQGAVAALVTAPLNKQAMRLAGFDYAGHTELLAERTGARKARMLLVGPQLRVIHVSSHVSLAEAIQRVRKANVLETIQAAGDACRSLGLRQPRIAVAGLNPHAGEAGLFGAEERDEIIPAVEAARQLGLHVSLPQPPDTVFLRAVKGEFDVVVAMYHDQGHIPMKLLAFDRGVNVSVGLPIVRTSVDHGTAFDIVGTGVAREDSLLAAIELAVRMVRARSDSDRPLQSLAGPRGPEAPSQ
jgi:4-hydroxythreonine-4-phosphate dehydrogenase